MYDEKHIKINTDNKNVEFLLVVQNRLRFTDNLFKILDEMWKAKN